MSPAVTLALRRSAKAVAVVSVLLLAKTAIDQQSFPQKLAPEPGSMLAAQFLDRNGERLNVTLQNHWNFHDYRPLHRIPSILLNAFIYAEDKRFFDHHGVDWSARVHAIKQNLQAGHIVRGASTITEQVVRLLHPRPRTFWSRWLEGWEAMRLEAGFSKAEILEFYLNQVPYGRQRRGVVQAAHRYFNRDLSTLNDRELLSLAVLVRAPGRLDPLTNPRGLDEPVERLANSMVNEGVLQPNAKRLLLEESLQLSKPSLAVDAAHFVQQLKSDPTIQPSANGKVTTTIDAALQRRVQAILDNRIRYLRSRQVSDGAVLVIDHLAGEVLAWVNGGGFSNADGQQIDAVTTPRQPGSTLKPFLYGMAIEKGWTAATLIDDSPLTIAVGNGLHSITNYSHQYYGPLRLREALGNSLNVPAIRAAAFVGREHFLDRLHRLGFASLTQHPDFYGDGLGLGNGEVTLLELVRAYSVLARGGVERPVRMAFNQFDQDRHPVRIFDSETTSLIGDILSDPDARAREFGRDSILRMPVQTAVKTGTSTDYRDAWAVGYTHRYTVGVWMGNLDQRPMNEVTGSVGPGMVLRAVFAELNRFSDSRPLVKSLALRSVSICPVTGLLAAVDGPSVSEWFRPGTEPSRRCDGKHSRDQAMAASATLAGATPKLKQPIPGLQLAMDPRIPDEKEVLPFELENDAGFERIEWVVDGKTAARTKPGKAYVWPLRRGQHSVYARLWSRGESRARQTRTVSFYVK